MYSPLTLNLVKVAFGGAFVLLGTSSFLKWRIQVNLKKNLLYLKSLEILRNSEIGLQQLGGAPITVKWIDMTDSENNVTSDVEAKMLLPVVGKRNRGMLYTEAHRTEQGWELGEVKLVVEGRKKKVPIYQPELEGKIMLTMKDNNNS